jgi:hypothetical protein
MTDWTHLAQDTNKWKKIRQGTSRPAELLLVYRGEGGGGALLREVTCIMKQLGGQFVEGIRQFHFISLNEQKSEKNVSHKLVEINYVSISN